MNSGFGDVKPVRGRPFVKGQSGNPGGRPRGQSVTAKLREALDARKLGDKKLPPGTTVADLLKDTVLKGALKGDFRFVQFLIERTEAHDELVAEVEALKEEIRRIKSGETAPDETRRIIIPDADPRHAP